MKWISVKKRLPEAHTDVIVHYKSGSILIGYLTYLGTWYQEQYFGEVTHWMPLPEPPKEV